MPSPQEKSCHVVELSVGPGGSRWAELHAYAEPALVRAVIEEFCRNPGGSSAYHAIWYGATLGVWTIQRGAVAGFLDLHPFLSVKLPGRAAAPLSDRAACDRLVATRRREIAAARGEDPDEVDVDEYDDVTDEIYQALVMTLDWPALRDRLPPLKAPLLGPGERATRHHDGEDARSYFFLADNVRFGSYEVECGDVLPGPVEFPALPTDEEEEDEEIDEDDSDEDDSDDDDDDSDDET